ncbi:MAG: ATPase, T2SS/T4P/T4SS family, partial [Gemmatimonadales bacterium]
MARLDKFIQVLAEQKADALELAHGKPASLLTAAGARPLTKDPVTAAQIVTLLREIAIGAPAASLAAGQGASFSYASPSGDVQVSFSAQDGGTAQLRLGSAPTAPAPRASGKTAAPPPAGHTPPPTRASQMYRAVADELEGPRKKMELLFRQLVETSSSDLHLRTGEPPLLRTHGEMRRTEGAALGEADLEVMLRSIMTPKATGEYKERNDTDWAYEIDGLARFRCNAGRDRLGPFGVFRVIPTTVLTADQLGLSQEVQNLAYLTKGLVVVTGPTGSGKSTTLASIVDLVNRSRADHIITI